MKKFILTVGMLLLFQSGANSATTIIENYDAKTLKNDIVAIYALKNSTIESNKQDKYTFSVRENYNSLWNIYSFKKNITIVQNGKNCILELNTTSFSNPYDARELMVLKRELQGGYTYGLNYFINVKTTINPNYLTDGIDSNGTPMRMSNSNNAEQVYEYAYIPKSIFRGPKLISTSYDAQNKGLKAKYRIVEINGKPICKYAPEMVGELLNPTSANETIEIGYKQKCCSKVQHVKLQSMYQKPVLENL